ncbi:MAG: PAS domain S-box protein [Candidatus Omnitrophica bacterium]|nr:PAS domain S-box protein [Candidatus Omnitrophota bacterium]MBU0895028.1 PAS domain S-box protein [Candidatus Omnitrophota bacterium]MBU1038274.1 PAS domain S-box protein [Candidatus Omnitrophota bacterium]
MRNKNKVLDTDKVSNLERKRIDAQLRKSDERYRALTEMAEDLIYMVDKSGHIVYINTFGAAYFGKKPKDMIGKYLPDMFLHEEAAHFMRSFRKVLKTGKSVFIYGEFGFHGSRFWLDTRLSPITDDNGKITHIMGISRDVTSYRRAEEVLERDKVELERLVRENSKKLLATQKKLDRAGRLADIGTISATIAHELRSPLAAIGLAAYNIRTKSKDPQISGNIRNIEIKVLESDQIIKNLLLYSGLKSPIREVVKVCELLSECVDLAHSMFPEHDIKIRKIFKCPRDTTLKADPVQLQEVFNNILNNSCESFEKKKGDIKISASVYKEGKFRIVFKDNGPGISPAVLEHIYEPFNSTKAEGTGLGLPVCRQIVNLHGGKMDIVSLPGKGTTITIYLPACGRTPRGQAGLPLKNGQARGQQRPIKTEP